MVCLKLCLTCDFRVTQSFGSGYDHITIAHLRYIIDEAHITARYRTLLVQLSVKDHDAVRAATAPKLLLDDTNSFDVAAVNHFLGSSHPALLVQLFKQRSS